MTTGQLDIFLGSHVLSDKYVILMNRFIRLLISVNWLIMYNLHDLQDKVNYFISCFLDIVESVFPLMLSKFVTIRRDTTNEWYTDDLRKLKQRCFYYYELYLRCGLLEYKQTYTRLRKTYRNSVNASKIGYYSTIVNNSENKTKATWNIVYQIINKNSNINNNNNSEFSVQNFVNNVTYDNSNKDNNVEHLLQNISKPSTVFSFRHVTVEETYCTCCWHT